jgi:phage-related protein
VARKKIGEALRFAQLGEKHPAAKALKGFGGAGVLEIVEEARGDAYRAVYTVRFANLVYTLHAFQKKSTMGVETPRRHVELLRKRFKAAEQDYRARKERG